MVSDKVVVTSQKAKENKTHVWESDGKGEYVISNSDREFTRGTEVVLHIKENERCYLDHSRVKYIIKNYSDYIPVPILLTDKNDIETKVNSSVALWTKARNKVNEDEYKNFYKSITNLTDEPWITIHNLYSQPPQWWNAVALWPGRWPQRADCP